MGARTGQVAAGAIQLADSCLNGGNCWLQGLEFAGDIASIWAPSIAAAKATEKVLDWYTRP